MTPPREGNSATEGEQGGRSDLVVDPSAPSLPDEAAARTGLMTRAYAAAFAASAGDDVADADADADADDSDAATAPPPRAVGAPTEATEEEAFVAFLAFLSSPSSGRGADDGCDEEEENDAVVSGGGDDEVAIAGPPPSPSPRSAEAFAWGRKSPAASVPATSSPRDAPAARGGDDVSASPASAAVTRGGLYEELMESAEEANAIDAITAAFVDSFLEEVNCSLADEDAEEDAEGRPPAEVLAIPFGMMGSNSATVSEIDEVSAEGRERIEADDDSAPVAADQAAILYEAMMEEASDVLMTFSGETELDEGDDNEVSVQVRPAVPTDSFLDEGVGDKSNPPKAETPPIADETLGIGMMTANSTASHSNNENEAQEEEDGLRDVESPFKVASATNENPWNALAARGGAGAALALAVYEATGRGDVDTRNSFKLELYDDGEGEAPLPPSLTVASHEATEGHVEIANAKLEPVKGEDVAPVPPVTVAALYDATEGSDPKAGNLKPEFDEGGDDAPVPTAAQATSLSKEVDEDKQYAARKPDMVDEEEPMPATQTASRFEDMDMALKDPITLASIPPDSEAQQLAAVLEGNSKEAFRKPPPVAASVSLEPRPADDCPPPVSVDDDSPPVMIDNVSLNAMADSTAYTIENQSNYNNEDQKEDEEEGSTSDADESVPLHIPNAYLVVDEETPPAANGDDPSVVIIDAYAEPLLPWWKQPRTRMLLSFVVLVVVVAIIVVVAVTMSSESSGGGGVAVATTTEVRVVQASASPSFSHAPSTSVPPSSSPTSCADAVSNAAESLEMPEFDGETTLNTIVKTDGRNAVVATRVSDSIHLVFFSSRTDDRPGEGGEGARWVRTDHFVEEYSEWNPNKDLYDFHVSLSGRTALLGLPSKDFERKKSRQFELPWSTPAGTGSGVVYVYDQLEQGSDGNDVSGERWAKAAEPLVPDKMGTYFGTRTDIRGDLGLAAVAAYHDKMIYLFRKNALHEKGALARWTQLATLRLNYNPASCYIFAPDTVLVIDISNVVIHLYKYDRGLDALVALQDPLEIIPQSLEDVFINLLLTPNINIEEIQQIASEAYEAGAGKLITNTAVANDYFVFTTSDSSFGQTGWDEQGVSVYMRHDAKDGLQQTFSLLQYFNSSDYDVGFGWELDIDDDLLIISGYNHSYVFSKQGNGYFEETLMLNEEHDYDYFDLLGRDLFILSRDDDGKEVVTVLNLETCTQQMPTQMPSFSTAPTKLHSVAPSHVPSFSSGPSSSLRPSHVPSFSAAPSRCYDVAITIVTGTNTGDGGGVIAWEFYEKNQTSGDVIFLNRGGPLERDQTYEYDIPCLPASSYVFNITESEGDGFGNCDSCGYFISIDGNLVGGNTYFWYADILTFPVPSVVQEGKDVTNGFSSPCHGDFYFALNTDENLPERTTWVLINGEGETVLSGGPYHKPKVTYTEWSCLSDGKYDFTIRDSEGDGNAVGNYVLGADYKTLVTSTLNFGTSNTTTFVSGPELT